jgi:hypothetical protein
MSKSRYPIPDQSRTPWFFLTLQTTQSGGSERIVGWELTGGNIQTRSEPIERTYGPTEEATALEELGGMRSNAMVISIHRRVVPLVVKWVLIKESSEDQLRPPISYRLKLPIGKNESTIQA